MTVVVTGASGHVGANLVRGLLARGRSVRVLIRKDRRAIQGLDVEDREGDVCDPASLRRAFEGADVVYHAAAHISILSSEWPLLESVNIIGTRNVVDACLASGVRRLVHFSSIHAICEEPLETPVDETHPLVDSQNCPHYDRSKAAGEREVQRGIERGLDVVILNPTSIIGPHDYKPSHVGEVLLSLAQGKMPAVVEGGFDWVDVRDIVEGAIRAEEKAAAGSRFLLSGHWVSVQYLAGTVAEITGVPAPRFVCPMWLGRVGAPAATAFARLSGKRPLFTSASLRALNSHRRISHERATRDLDYHPRPFDETVADALQWFVATGRLAPRSPRSKPNGTAR